MSEELLLHESVIRNGSVGLLEGGRNKGGGTKETRSLKGSVCLLFAGVYHF